MQYCQPDRIAECDVSYYYCPGRMKDETIGRVKTGVGYERLKLSSRVHIIQPLCMAKAFHAARCEGEDL
jgi:hypothetical protein